MNGAITEPSTSTMTVPSTSRMAIAGISQNRLRRPSVRKMPPMLSSLLMRSSVGPRQAIGLIRIARAPVGRAAAIAPALERVLADGAHDERDRHENDEEDERQEDARVDPA